MKFGFWNFYLVNLNLIFELFIIQKYIKFNYIYKEILIDNWYLFYLRMKLK